MSLCISCKSNKNKKDRIDLLNQNQDIFRFRLSKEEKIEYTETYFSYSKDEHVYRNDFPQLLGTLGTDISEKFALRIFDTFSSNKTYITLQEYLKYIDIYHHGNSQERCLITFKLMDFDKNGQIKLEYFKDYIDLIISAINKVHPLAEENLISKKEIQMLFIKISQNQSFFTFDQFADVFVNKPEIISWIDYFKNNEDDVSILINKTIKSIIRILLKFFNNMKHLNYEYESHEKNQESFLKVFLKISEEINKYSKTIDNLRKKFIENSSFISTKNVFNSIKSTFLKSSGGDFLNEVEDIVPTTIKENNIKLGKDKMNIKENNNIIEKIEKIEKLNASRSNNTNHIINDNIKENNVSIKIPTKNEGIEENKLKNNNPNIFALDNVTEELFTEYDNKINEQFKKLKYNIKDSVTKKDLQIINENSEIDSDKSIFESNLSIKRKTNIYLRDENHKKELLDVRIKKMNKSKNNNNKNNTNESVENFSFVPHTSKSKQNLANLFKGFKDIVKDLNNADANENEHEFISNNIKESLKSCNKSNKKITLNSIYEIDNNPFLNAVYKSKSVEFKSNNIKSFDDDINSNSSFSHHNDHNNSSNNNNEKYDNLMGKKLEFNINSSLDNSNNSFDNTKKIILFPNDFCVNFSKIRESTDKVNVFEYNTIEDQIKNKDNRDFLEIKEKIRGKSSNLDSEILTKENMNKTFNFRSNCKSKTSLGFLINFNDNKDRNTNLKINSKKLIKDFNETLNSIDDINSNINLDKRSQNLCKDSINTKEETNVSSSNFLNCLKSLNKAKGKFKDSVINDDYSLTQYSFCLEKNSNKITTDENVWNVFFKNFNNMTDTCIHTLNWINICYGWIQQKKLKQLIKLEKEKFNKETMYQVKEKEEFEKNINIPTNSSQSFYKNNVHKKGIERKSSTKLTSYNSKSSNPLKTTDVNFKLLIKVIMGIQLACQNSSNINLLERQLKLSDLSDFLKTNTYTIETSGKKKDENYFISEWAPVIFNNIRRLYSISKDSYVSSISPQEFITEMMISSTTIIEQLVSTGKSGSMFYYTKDGKFIIKTISKSEYEFLRNILPDYFMYIRSNKHTFIPKFYGCYKLIIKKNNSKDRLYFITMDNLFSTNNEIHLRYDLKGSTISRKILPLNFKIKEGEKYPMALKDLDFNDNTKYLFFGKEKKELILEQISKDIDFLESKKIIDYSLLVGIHYRKNNKKRDELKDIKDSKEFKDLKDNRESLREIDNNYKDKGKSINLKTNKSSNSVDNDSSKTFCDQELKEINSNENLNKNCNNILLNIDEYTDKSSYINSSMIYSDEESIPNYLQEESITQYYIGNKIKNHIDGGIECGNTSDNNNEIYYVGIIDILTEFKSFKTLEYLSKSIFYCSQDMSCVPPLKYKKRFYDYINSISK